MKMPKKIAGNMLAPCGMNCTVCYKHCNSNKPCSGCYSADNTKPAHCLSCKIKACSEAKKHSHCFECAEFPCKLNKNIERSYKKYNCSLITNGINARDNGVEIFLAQEREYWTCSRCGGIISLHDGYCSDCQTKLDDMKLGPYTYFGIIDDFDKEKDYTIVDYDNSFQHCLKKYNCIALPDDIIDDWWSNLTQLKTYYNSFSRQETNLNRYGVTLIPPEYLSKFASTITLHTSPKFQTLCDKELKALLTLLNQAIEEGKFIIHYGI